MKIPIEIAGVDNEDLTCCSACSRSQAALECCGGSLSFRLCMFCELAVVWSGSRRAIVCLKYCQHNVCILLNSVPIKAGEGCGCVNIIAKVWVGVWGLGDMNFVLYNLFLYRALVPFRAMHAISMGLVKFTYCLCCAMTAMTSSMELPHLARLHCTAQRKVIVTVWSAGKTVSCCHRQRQ
jgi:hypothetical protein